MNNNATNEQLRTHYFGGTRTNGYSRINTHIDDAINFPGLSQDKRMQKLQDADKIIELIENELTRNIYQKQVQTAREQIK